jgi:RNA polymerase sigma factor (sigma-70 family)
MAAGSLGSVLRHLRRLAGAPGTADPSDVQLLERFARNRDETAFAALVERHGPMVLGVCRRVLRHEQDAEDAFQATFLVLARKAGAAGWRDSLGSWLYTVAYRLALRARAAAARRQLHERKAARMTRTASGSADEPGDLRPVLDEELSRLPEKYRAPLVLCYLQDKTQAEAARALGWPVGSMSMRLARGRELLRRRLERRGVRLATGALVAAVPAVLAQATVRAAVLVTGGAASGPAAALAKGMLRVMLLARLKAAAAALLVMGAAAGAGLLACQALAGRPGEDQPAADAPKPAEATAPRTDRYGDPLPEGAVARLGTVRWRHSRNAHGLVFSPDDKVLASVCWDRAVLWDVASGRQLRELSTPPLTRYGGPAFTPDGKTLVLHEPSGDISFWDVATGKRGRTLTLPHEKMAAEPWTHSLCLSPDGKVIAVGGDTNQLYLLDAADGHVLHRICSRNEAPIYPYAFSPDGTVLVANMDKDSVHLWDVATGKVLRGIPYPKDRDGFSFPCTFAPDGKVLAFRGRDLIALADVATGKEVGRFEADMGMDWSVAFTPDGKTLVSGSQDGRVRVWDLATTKLRFTLDSRTNLGTDMALSHDGKTVALGSQYSAIHLWNAATGQELFTDFHGHDAPVGALAFMPDARGIVTASYSGEAYLWDPATGRQLRDLRLPGAGWVFAPDGTRLLTVELDWTMHVRDAGTGAEVCPLERSKTALCHGGLEFSRDGKLLVGCGWYIPNGDQTKRSAALFVWDAVTGKQIRQAPLPGIDLAEVMRVLTHRPLALTLNGRTAILSDPKEGMIRLYDLEEGKQVLSLAGHKKYAGAFVLSADGKTLLSGSLDRSVRLWDLVAGREVAALEGHRRAVAAVALSPDGRLAASAGGVPYLSDSGVPISPHDDVTGPRRIRLWDVATCREVGHFEGHTADVTSLAFSPDGCRLVSGLRDGTVLVWDVTALRLPALGVGADELNGLWRDLAGTDAFKAHQAVWRLAAAPEKSIPFLKAHVEPAAGVGPKQLHRLIADLDSNQFAVRAAAVQELERLGEPAAPALRQALAGSPSAELRKQAEDLLADLRLVRSPEVLQQLRAVEVLERAGTPEARQLLEALAKGAPEARLTRDAHAALDRLGR